jgi:hypothetical protein
MVFPLALSLALQDIPDWLKRAHEAEQPVKPARIHRSTAARNAFRKTHPCPATEQIKGPCKGYVVDHVIAQSCGGADNPSNMQWPTTADARAKDKWERNCEK